MNDNVPPFAFGQQVWVVSASSHYPTKEPCPICFGERAVVLILGNGEHQGVACDFCSRGCDPPSGEATVYRAMSRIYPGVVTGLEKEFDQWRIRVDHASHLEDDAVVFADRDAAEARRIILHAEVEQRAQRLFEQTIAYGKKKTAWNAGYHRREIADLERKLAWHRDKLARPTTAVKGAQIK